jgi:hypothetical protein
VVVVTLGESVLATVLSPKTALSKRCKRFEISCKYVKTVDGEGAGAGAVAVAVLVLPVGVQVDNDSHCAVLAAGCQFSGDQQLFPWHFSSYRQ